MHTQMHTRAHTFTFLFTHSLSISHQTTNLPSSSCLSLLLPLSSLYLRQAGHGKAAPKRPAPANPGQTSASSHVLCSLPALIFKHDPAGGKWLPITKNYVKLELVQLSTSSHGRAAIYILLAMDGEREVSFVHQKFVNEDPETKRGEILCLERVLCSILLELINTVRLGAEERMF